MLQRLSGQISDCLERAAEARRRAEETTDARRKADFLAQERSWGHLADSYRFAESLDRFLHGEMADGWRPAASAPFEQQLELAVIDTDTTHALVFPCCRAADGWIDARTGRRIDIVPTHWREWVELAPRGRQLETGAGWDGDMRHGHEIVVFENDEASLRVARGDNDLFELIVRVHGEEVTAYDLDGDRLATIGRRLLTLAGKTSPAAAQEPQAVAGALS
jgi:hypothetical protein